MKSILFLALIFAVEVLGFFSISSIVSISKQPVKAISFHYGVDENCQVKGFEKYFSVSEASGKLLDKIYSSNEYFSISKELNLLKLNSEIADLGSELVVFSRRDKAFQILSKDFRSSRIFYFSDYFDTKDGPFVFYADPTTEQVYLAQLSQDGGQIVALDHNGVKTASFAVDFSFTDFGHFGAQNGFAFFRPMAVHQGTGCIRLTNESMEVITDIMEIPEIVASQNPLSSGTFKFYDGRLYFNPILTDDIVEIQSDGSIKFIYQGNLSMEAEKKMKREVDGLEPNSLLSYYCRPIVDFLVSSEYIFLKKNTFDHKVVRTMFERKSGRSVTWHNAIKLSNLNNNFHFLFDHISGIGSDGYLYSLRSGDEFTSILEQLQSANEVDWISDRLHHLSQEGRGLIHQYRYDFEFIYKNSVSMNNEDGRERGQLKVCPNPVSNDLKITYIPEEDMNEEGLTIDILNSQGRMMKQVSKNGLDQSNNDSNQFETTVDVTELPDGFYIVWLKNTKGDLNKSFKFYKQN